MIETSDTPRLFKAKKLVAFPNVSVCFCFFLWVDKFNDFVAYRSLDCQCVFTRCVHYNPFGRGVEWGGFDRTSCIIHQKLSKSKR